MGSQTPCSKLMDGYYKNYRKKNIQPMRPYVPGEHLSGVSVSKEDMPEEGGMIACNPNNPADKWYVAKKFFEENYEEVCITGPDESVLPGQIVSVLQEKQKLAEELEKLSGTMRRVASNMEEIPDIPSQHAEELKKASKICLDWAEEIWFETFKLLDNKKR